MDNQQGQGMSPQQPSTNNTPQPVQSYGQQVITPAQQAPSYSSSSAPYAQGEGNSVVYDSQSVTGKSRKPLLILACVAVVIVAAALVIAKEIHLPLGGKFASYTYVGKRGQDYSIEFYRGATMQTLKGTNESELTASKVSSYPYPVALGIGGSENDSTSMLQKDVTESNNCTYDTGSTEAFRIYIPGVEATANFCTDEGIRYVSFFSSGRSIYDIVIQENHPDSMTQNQVTDLLDHPLNKTDLKTIVASFKP